ncbi:MAG TPA: cytochrome c oxidase subunit II [Planctomycetota bacterium]|nr:cytochrome c oxidase subunit II [Planctomycetota bacterium]
MRKIGTAAALAASGCTGPQSALDPAGPDARLLAHLFWGMSIGSAVVWLVVVALTLHAFRPARRPVSTRAARLLLLGGGVALPTAVLTGLLAYALALLPRMLAPAPPGSLTIEVTGYQWWWRVRYLRPGDEPVELANEIRLPVGESVDFRLAAADVIHSFWIPALGGKVDMIPGRRTRLHLRAARTGTFRGVCAEYCGTAHALMAFDVVVHERDEFERWLARQAQPAPAPEGDLAARGAEAFLANGCGACHAVRGTAADGVVGPDLTWVGGRQSLGAGTLRNGVDALRAFVARTDALKPGVHMPSFGMLADDDLSAIAAWLGGLR